jgi:hypothetical protein
MTKAAFAAGEFAILAARSPVIREKDSLISTFFDIQAPNPHQRIKEYNSIIGRTFRFTKHPKVRVG